MKFFKQAIFTGVLISFLSLTGVDVVVAKNMQTLESGAVQVGQQQPVLMVISADTGSIAKTKKGYVLELKNVDKKALWFTDKPGRKAGFVKTKHFIKIWDLILKKSPPNSALIHAGITAKSQDKSEPIAVELSEPTFKGNVLSFNMKSLGDSPIKTGNLTDVRLFLDDVDVTCCIALTAE